MTNRFAQASGSRQIRTAVAILLVCAAWTLAKDAALADVFTVTRTDDAAHGICDADCSLRDAIAVANQREGMDRVDIPAGTYVLGGGALEVSDELALVGSGTEGTIIDGGHLDRVFAITTERSVSIAAVTIRNGLGSGGGGAIRNVRAQLSLADCVLVDNRILGEFRAPNAGGGLLNDDGHVEILRCVFMNNYSGIYNGVNGSVSVMDSTFSANFETGGNNGGAIDNRGTLTVRGSHFEGNSAPSGGAVDNSGTAHFDQCEFVLNHATGPSPSGDGGALSNSGTLTLEHCTLTENSTSTTNSNGGGVYNKALLSVHHSIFDKNGAPGGGGGLYNEAGGEAELADSSIMQCSTGGFGGGIFNRGSFNIARSVIFGNRASDGGGAFNFAGLMVENTSFLFNYASYGGAIADGSLGPIGTSVNYCTFNFNEAIRGTFTTGSTIYTGYFYPGHVAISASILATQFSGNACIGSGIVDGGNNLSSDFTCPAGLHGDPYLIFPGDFGGPTTTSALCEGPGVPSPECAGLSPAIDAARGSECPPTDQRGAQRPAGEGCDIGAFESGAQIQEPTATPVVTPTSTPGEPPTICVGDCNGVGAVRIDGLITLVNIALERADATSCAHGIPAEAEVDIALLIQAVNNALGGCA